jgi:hypothetical protein
MVCGIGKYALILQTEFYTSGYVGDWFSAASTTGG